MFLLRMVRGLMRPNSPKKNTNAIQQHSHSNQGKSSKRNKKKSKRAANAEKSALITKQSTKQQQIVNQDNESASSNRSNKSTTPVLTHPINDISTSNNNVVVTNNTTIITTATTQSSTPVIQTLGEGVIQLKNDKNNLSKCQGYNACKSSIPKMPRKRSPVWLKFPTDEDVFEREVSDSRSSTCRPGKLYSDVLFGSNNVSVPKPTPKSDLGRLSCPSSKTAQKRLTKALLMKCGGGEFNINGDLEKNRNFFPSLNELNRIHSENPKPIIQKPAVAVTTVPQVGEKSLGVASASSNTTSASSTTGSTITVIHKPTPLASVVSKAPSVSKPVATVTTTTTSPMKNNCGKQYVKSKANCDRPIICKTEPSCSKITTPSAYHKCNNLSNQKKSASISSSSTMTTKSLASSVNQTTPRSAAVEEKDAPISNIDFQRSSDSDSDDATTLITKSESIISLSMPSTETDGASSVIDEDDLDADVVVLSETDGVHFSKDVYSTSYGSYLENHFSESRPKCQEIAVAPSKPMSLAIQLDSWNFLEPDINMEPYPKFLCCFNDEEYLMAEKLALLGLKLALGNQSLEGRFEL